MTAKGVLPELTDVINESDISEEDDLLNSRIQLEDLHYELDVRRYYRIMLGDNFSSRNSNLSFLRHKKSKAVQTDPDSFNIPPSWLLQGGDLIEELYTGLGNIINTMYHNSKSLTKEDARQQSVIDPNGMKYFTYDNGYWQSKLIPGIRIPDRVEQERQNRDVCSKETQKKLRRLLEVATKLRNVLPYVTCDETNQNLPTATHLGSSEQQTREPKRSKSPCLPEHDACDVSDDSSECKSDSRNSSAGIPEYCEVPKHKRQRVQNCDAMGTLNGEYVTFYGDCENQIPGVQVSRYSIDRPTKPSQLSTLVVPKLLQRDMKAEISRTNKPRTVEKSTSVTIPTSSKVHASCSTDFKLADKSNRIHYVNASTKPSREKPVVCDQENCSKNKPHTGNVQKNFIKRNIMALKNKVNRAGNGAVRNDLRDNLEHHFEVNENRNRRCDTPNGNRKKFIRYHL